jgi:hypothetical protein
LVWVKVAGPACDCCTRAHVLPCPCVCCCARALPFVSTLSAAAAPFEFAFEEAQLTEQNVRDLVYQEMMFYHPENC